MAGVQRQGASPEAHPQNRPLAIPAVRRLRAISAPLVRPHSAAGRPGALIGRQRPWAPALGYPRPQRAPNSEARKAPQRPARSSPRTGRYLTAATQSRGGRSRRGGGRSPGGRVFFDLRRKVGYLCPRSGARKQLAPAAVWARGAMDKNRRGAAARWPPPPHGSRARRPASPPLLRAPSGSGSRALW